jgi:hypothetical protein
MAEGGVNGDSRGGIKAGELGVLIGISMMEAGRHGAINCGEARWRLASGRPARGRGGSDGWGPLGSDVTEETPLTNCANSKKRRLLANTPRLLRPSGPSGPSARTTTYGAGLDGLESEVKLFPNKI